MHCLHVITGLETGGSEMMLLKLVEHTEGGQLHNHVVSLTTLGTIGPVLSDRGVTVNALGMRSGIPSPRAIARLAAIMRRAKIEVVQTWMYHANLLGGLAAVAAGRPPVVWNLRAANLQRGSEKLSTLALARVSGRVASAICRSIVTNSEHARRVHTAMGYPQRLFRVIPNGFDTQRFRPDAVTRHSVRAELGVPNDAVLIGLVGRYHPSKGHSTFLEAAGILAREHPKVQFVLIGDGAARDNPELTQHIRARALGDRLHALGRRMEMPPLFTALDIYTSASLYESFPNVLGEAMSSGVPCVATDVGDCARVVGDTGRIIPPGDVDALVSAWRELLALGDAGRGNLGRRARRRIEEHFRIDVVADQYVQLYQELVNGSERGS
ncbi:MAG: glycosyltransferase family 4 protein [Gemmatimonadaceae bacterium]